MISSELIGSGIKIKHLHVTGSPHSAGPEDLLKTQKIDASNIIKEVKSFKK